MHFLAPWIHHTLSECQNGTEPSIYLWGKRKYEHNNSLPHLHRTRFEVEEMNIRRNTGSPIGRCFLGWTLERKLWKECDGELAWSGEFCREERNSLPRIKARNRRQDVWDGTPESLGKGPEEDSAVTPYIMVFLSNTDYVYGSAHSDCSSAEKFLL